MKNLKGTTGEFNVRSCDQITYQVISHNGYVAAIGTSRPPLVPPRHGQAALHLFQKHLLSWVFLHNFSHCGRFVTYRRSVPVDNARRYVRITSSLTSLPLHISAETGIYSDHYRSWCRFFIHSVEWIIRNTKFESLKTADLNNSVLNLTSWSLVGD